MCRFAHDPELARALYGRAGPDGLMKASQIDPGEEADTDSDDPPAFVIPESSKKVDVGAMAAR